jgi:hypothetical protein
VFGTDFVSWSFGFLIAGGLILEKWWVRVMDYRLEAKLKAMIEGLAREHQQELAEAGTLVDLEELTCRIGDMVTRELTQREVTRRAEALDVEEALCPTCGGLCPRGEPEPVVLDGLRGELAYRQPSYFCRRCRRSFFPGGRVSGTGGAEHGHAERLAEDGLVGEQSEQLRDGRRGPA